MSDGLCVAKKELGVNCAGDAECQSDECAPGYCEGYEDDLCYEDDDCIFSGGGSCIGEVVCVAGTGH